MVAGMSMDRDNHGLRCGGLALVGDAVDGDEDVGFGEVRMVSDFHKRAKGYAWVWALAIILQ